jgi:molybdopterin converting factor small subunit
MTTVTVNLYAGLRTFIDDKPSVDVDVEPGTTIARILDRLEVPAEKTRIIFLNNRAADLTDSIEPGDQLSIFPAIGGG